MGLIRSLAKKVLGKVAGRDAPAVSTPRAEPRPDPRPDPGGRPAASTVTRAPERVAVAGDEEPVVENAEALSTIECSAQEIKERLDAGEPVTVLDVREPSETAGGIIPGALLIPLGQLRARWEEVKDANEVVCYCAMGARSLQAAHFLREKGLFNATSLDGGISGWMEIGGKVTRPA
ncbi:MAG: rhodanese-like domain-containing protein [Pseudomonadota bacterium]|nr:rhodanese-like domain-containing protein [Pseudomonadota bacterium]